jgi:hypothetical protein
MTDTLDRQRSSIRMSTRVSPPYLIGGHHTQISDGVIVSLDQAPLERQEALTPSTFVEISRSAADGKGQGLVTNRWTLVLVRMEHPILKSNSS